jgi:geranylgeranyl pyrophosphate synthase
MIDLPKLVQRHLAQFEEYIVEESRRAKVDFISDGFAYQISTGGKRLRPALCLATCEVLGGSPRDALPFALASEILHNFLLVHDDIEDGDTVRRDQATLWVRFGVANALNVSDFMIARAYRLILESPLAVHTNLRLATVFSFALQKTVEGQALDINLRGSTEVDLETYHRIVRLKTAYYLALTWVGGAIVAGAADDSLDPLWELGKRLGPAFQIRDDIIDLTDGKGRGGAIGCDIREGKPSIFYSYILDRKPGTEADRTRLVDIFRRPREATSDEDIDWAIDYFRSHGALQFAEEEARRLAVESQRVLDTLPWSEEGRRGFREIIEFIIDRKF